MARLSGIEIDGDDVDERLRPEALDDDERPSSPGAAGDGTSKNTGQALDDEIERLEKVLWGTLANLDKLLSKHIPEYKAFGQDDAAAQNRDEQEKKG